MEEGELGDLRSLLFFFHIYFAILFRKLPLVAVHFSPPAFCTFPPPLTARLGWFNFAYLIHNQLSESAFSLIMEVIGCSVDWNVSAVSLSSWPMISPLLLDGSPLSPPSFCGDEVAISPIEVLFVCWFPARDIYTFNRYYSDKIQLVKAAFSIDVNKTSNPYFTYRYRIHYTYENLFIGIMYS